MDIREILFDAKDLVDDEEIKPFISLDDKDDDLEFADPPETEDCFGFSCCIAAGFSSEKRKCKKQDEE